jgi:hypothetical protein
VDYFTGKALEYEVMSDEDDSSFGDEGDEDAEGEVRCAILGTIVVRVCSDHFVSVIVGL